MRALRAMLCGLLLITAAVAAPATPSGAVTPTLHWSAPHNPDPFRGYATGISCVSASWCMVVDASGQAVRYHSGVWDRPVRVEHADPLAGLQTVSCATTRFCMAADGNGLFTRWNGSTWTAPAQVGTHQIESLSCASAYFCVGVGDRTMRWNGSRWSVGRLPFPGASVRLSCARGQFCLAAYNTPNVHTPHMWRYGRAGWTKVPLGRWVGFIDAVSCLSRTLCWVEDSSIGPARFDGTRLVATRPSYGPMDGPFSCATATACLSIEADVNRAPQSSVWNGREWSSSTRFDPAGLASIAAVSCVGTALTCFAVDVGGRVTEYRNHRWGRTRTIDPGRGVDPIAACGTTMCLTADVAGGFLRTTGHGWTPWARSLPGSTFGRRATEAVSCASDTFCVELADDRTAARYDGHRWYREPSVPFDNATLSCLGPHWCLAMNQYTGRVSTYDGSRWRRPFAWFGNSGEPWELSCGSRTMCVASSWDGLVRVFDGARWGRAKRIETPINANGAVSCSSATFCLAMGRGDTWRFDGSRWHKSAGASEGPESISCTSSTFCAAVELDAVDVFDGRTWHRSFTAPDYTETYSSISCASRRLCVIAAQSGTVSIGTS